MNIFFDTSPLKTDHAIRGIGMYTKQLKEALDKISEVTIQETKNKDTELVHYPYFDLYFDTLPVSVSKKTVVTIHDVIPLEFPDFYKPGVKGKLRFRKQLFALKFVKAIITDSMYSKQQIHKLLGVSLEKIHVVYLSSNKELSPQPPSKIAAAREKFTLPENYILYVGDINYNKNIPQLLKAVKYLSEDIHLVCVGKNFVEQEIPEWQWIESQLEMSQVTDRVHFLPNVPQGENQLLSALYSGAIAYVQPSLSEGFGLPVLDALRCRCPVISSNRGSLPEVGGEVPIYVEPTAEDIASGVEKVLSLSLQSKRKLLDRGAEWAETFSWEKAAQETLTVYKKVLAKK